VIGDLDDFGLAIPNICTEIRAVFRSLSPQRCRSLLLVPSRVNGDVVNKGLYQLLVHI
jgi:hypothetical protein